MKEPWTTILSNAELEARYALTASIDPNFARSERIFWETRTPSQLKVLAAQAWDASDPDGFQMARTYSAIKETSQAA